MVAQVINDIHFSAEAQQRLKQPRCRGMFRPIDAARRQLGLLSAGDDRGQCRLYMLINMDTQVVEDARFLAFGDLRSHPIADAYTEHVRQLPVDQALQCKAETIDAILSNEQAAFSDYEDSYAFLDSLQHNLKQALPSVKLLPKPIEKEVYKRKREADWTEADQSWFPLSLLKKIGSLQKCIQGLLSNKLKRDDFTWSIEGLHDDFKIVIKITGAQSEEIPTLLRFMEEAVRQDVHPDLSVEEHS